LEISGKGTVEAIGGGVTIAKYNGQGLVLGDSYTLKAIPAAGYKFSGWGQGETSASLSFVMSSNLVFTPSFAQITR
jgi:hypothetical protein